MAKIIIRQTPIDDSIISNSSGSYSVSLPPEQPLVLPDENIQVTDSLDVVLATYSNSVYDDIVIEVPVARPPLVVNEWMELVVDTRIPGLTANNQFKFRLQSGQFYSITADLQEGGDLFHISGTDNNAAGLTLTFATEGVHTILLKGLIPFNFNTQDDSTKVIGISNFGIPTIYSLNQAFRCPNLVIAVNDVFQFKGTDARNAFSGAINVTGDFKITTSAMVTVQFMFISSGLNADLGYYDLRRCSNFGGFAQSVTTWSTENYGATLMGWLRWDSNTHAPAVGWVLQSNMSFDGGNSTLVTGSEAALARQYLIDILGWTITDGGLV